MKCVIETTRKSPTMTNDSTAPGKRRIDTQMGRKGCLCGCIGLGRKEKQRWNEGWRAGWVGRNVP